MSIGNTPDEPVATTPGPSRDEPANTPDGDPTNKVIWAIGITGGTSSILQLLLWMGNVKPASGVLLLLLLAIPVVSLLGAVYVIAKQFSAQIAKLSSDHTNQISLIADRLKEESETARELIRTVESHTQSARATAKLIQHALDSAHDLRLEAVASVSRPAPGLTELELARQLKRTCHEVAKAFSESTGVVCRICVKQVCEGPGQRNYVRTVCRDVGQSGDDSGIPHYVSANTDFNELWFQKQTYWFSDDVKALPAERYKNTSPSYDYRSVIVVPIVSRMNLGPNEKADADTSVVGFLCLDSVTVAAFDEDLHVPVLTTIADAMANAYEAHYLTFRDESHSELTQAGFSAKNEGDE